MRFSKNSYYLLIIIPVLVKFTSKLVNPMQVHIGEIIYEFELTLPFSWMIFYFGAISIAIGTIVYTIFCPDIVKKFKNYGEFEKMGVSDEYLEKQSKNYTYDESIYNRFNSEPEFIKIPKEYPKDFKGRRGFSNTIQENIANLEYKTNRRDFFNNIYDSASNSKQYLIYINFIFYLAGFMAFLYVISENFFYVINQL